MTNTSALRFALFGNIYQSKKSANVAKIISFLSERKAEICIERQFFEFLEREQRLTVDGVQTFDNGEFTADFVISTGGDGTLLRAASHVGNKGIPIVGVNMGRLGFLSDFMPSEIEAALQSLYDGNYQTERHAVIQLECNGRTLAALNDIAVLKRDNASMISIRASVGGEYLVTYQADGLIVSTPTGSTAYSLSNGGPIITPNTDILCLTPVAPHSLNIRPIVVDGQSVIELKVESRNHNFLVAIDGQSERCDEGTTLTIRRAPYDISIVKRSGRRYFSTLREKMMWGADTRG